MREPIGTQEDTRLGYVLEQQISSTQAMEVDKRLVLEHRQDPLHTIEGIEVLENTHGMKSKDGGKGDLGKFIKKILMPAVIANPLTVVAVTGRSGLGKGTLLMGFGRVIDANLYIQQELGRKPRIVSSPYASAWRTAQVHSELGVISPNVLVGTIDRESSISISQFEWKMLEQEVIEPKKDTDEHTLLLVEASTPTAMPDGKEVPVGITDVSPNDRGVSVIFNLARDPRTREHTYIFTMDRDSEVQNKNVKGREDLSVAYARPNNLYSTYEQNWVVNSQGELVDESLLSPDDQSRYRNRLGLSRAPGDSIPRINKQMDGFEETVLGYMPDNDYPFYKMMQKELDLDDTHFQVVQNPYFDETTTADDRYITSWNLFYRLYPDIYGNLRRN